MCFCFFFLAHILFILCDLLFTSAVLGIVLLSTTTNLTYFFHYLLLPTIKKVGVYFDYRSMHASYNRIIIFILFLTSSLSSGGRPDGAWYGYT